jgi:hypothetical protein
MKTQFFQGSSIIIRNMPVGLDGVFNTFPVKSKSVVKVIGRFPFKAMVEIIFLSSVVH